MQLPKIGVSGEYRFQVSKNGKVIRDTGFFPNLITDNGLNLICNATEPSDNAYRFFFSESGPLYSCYVGEGGTQPAASDTQLVSRITTASSVQESVSATSSNARGYAEIVIAYRFDAGEAAGNVSEVGVGPSPTSLFSRALIRDANGDPITITVLDDELLTVTYRLRLAIPQQDILQTIMVDIGGTNVETNVTIRPYATELYSVTSTPSSHAHGWGIKRTFGNGANSVNTTSATDLFAPTTATPTPSSVSATSVALDPYTNNSFQRTASATFATTISNRPIAVWCYSFGPGSFQVKFDPPINKTNQQALRLSFGYQVARA